MQLKAKKSLGQNFLTDKNIIDKIVKITKIYKSEIPKILNLEILLKSSRIIDL